MTSGPAARGGRVPTAVRRRAAATGGLVVVLTAAGLLAAGPAQAHDVLLGTVPAAGSTVAVLPDLVVLHFDAPAQALGTAVVVRGPGGDVAAGPAELIDSDVEVAVRTGSPAGPYTVAWRVVSADGHVVQGTFAFTARGASTGTAPPQPSAVPAVVAAGTAGGPGATWWVGGGVLAGLLVAGAIVVLRRRRAREEDDDEADDDEDGLTGRRADGPAPTGVRPASGRRPGVRGSRRRPSPGRSTRAPRGRPPR